jgi:hypothetical protein
MSVHLIIIELFRQETIEQSDKTDKVAINEKYPVY